MRRYITFIVAPFILSAVIAGQVAQPKQTPTPTSPTGPGPPAQTPPDPPKSPPADIPAGDAPKKGLPPQAKPETPPGKTVVAPPPPAVTLPPPPEPTSPGTCPPGQTCTDPTTPPIAAPKATTAHSSQYLLSSDMNFVGRVEMAAMSVVTEVLAEPETTANHEARMKFVGHVMREPDFAARKLARLVAVSIPITLDKSGFATTSATDAQITALLRQRWTALSKSMGQLF